MDPASFKAQWITSPIDSWLYINNFELENSPLNESTKKFLSYGLPRDASPFLNFDHSATAIGFDYLYKAYSKWHPTEATKNYWQFGSDGEGNPICFDISKDDRIVLLDHEQRFELIDVINKNISEFATCLLSFKRFIASIRVENGDNAYTKRDIKDSQIEKLTIEFNTANPNLLTRGSFWDRQIKALTD